MVGVLLNSDEILHMTSESVEFDATPPPTDLTTTERDNVTSGPTPSKPKKKKKKMTTVTSEKTGKKKKTETMEKKTSTTTTDKEKSTKAKDQNEDTLEKKKTSAKILQDDPKLKASTKQLKSNSISAKTDKELSNDSSHKKPKKKSSSATSKSQSSSPKAKASSDSTSPPPAAKLAPALSTSSTGKSKSKQNQLSSKAKKTSSKVAKGAAADATSRDIHIEELDPWSKEELKVSSSTTATGNDGTLTSQRNHPTRTTSSSSQTSTSSRVGAIAMTPTAPARRTESQQPEIIDPIPVTNPVERGVSEPAHTTDHHSLMDASVTVPAAEDGTITATAVTREDLENEVAERILREAVTAEVIPNVSPADNSKSMNRGKVAEQPAFRNRRILFLLCAACCCLVLVIGVIVGAVVGAKNSKRGSNTEGNVAGGNSSTGNINQSQPAPFYGNLTSQQEEVLTFLQIRSPDHGVALNNPSTPQYQAFSWLLHDLPLHNVEGPASDQDQKLILT